MEEMGKNWEVELVKSIDSVAKQCAARLGECFRNQAIVSIGPNVVVKSEGSPRVPPCLNYVGGSRTFGLIPRMDQPPTTKKGFGSDSVITEKRIRPIREKLPIVRRRQR